MRGGASDAGDTRGEVVKWSPPVWFRLADAVCIQNLCFAATSEPSPSSIGKDRQFPRHYRLQKGLRLVAREYNGKHAPTGERGQKKVPLHCHRDVESAKPARARR
jgi:hypothetical protein